MKLTSDLIREVLICIEKNLSIESDLMSLQISSIHWSKIFKDEYLCQRYDIDNIKYCIYKLKEEGLIKGLVINGVGGRIISIDIDDITWNGYELLNNIKDDNLWDVIKTKLGGVTKFSISVLSAIAKETLTNWGLQQLSV